MILFFVLFFFSMSCANAVEKNLSAKIDSPLKELPPTEAPKRSPPIAPLLPLSPHLPVSLNRAVDQITEEEEELEALRNLALYHQKLFPWVPLLVVTLLSLFGYLVRLAPPGRNEQLVKALKYAAILHKLEGLKKADLAPGVLYRRLDHLLREGLEPEIAASTMTAEELLIHLQATCIGEEELVKELSLFIQEAELVKFAQKEPSREKFLHAQELISRAIFFWQSNLLQ